MILWVLLINANLGIAEFDFSTFIATRVLKDKCYRTEALEFLAVYSVISCATLCSENSNCKRFMTCKRTNLVECSLFYEGENCATVLPDGCSCYIKAYSLVKNNTLCPLGLYGNSCGQAITDCSDGSNHGLDNINKWVRAYIKPLTSSDIFEIVCDFQNGYTMFMSRNRGCEDLSFNRNLSEYVNGFGDSNGDYWSGLDRIKHVLNNHPMNWLTVLLMDEDYVYKENFYDNFTIGSSDSNYPIQLGNYNDQIFPTLASGNSLTGVVNIEGSPFSAPGSDHTSYNCADNLQGGWWFADDPACSESSLTGSKYNMIWPTSLGYDPQYITGLRIKPNVI